MNKTDLKDWTREMLELEIINMNAKNFQLQSDIDNLQESNMRLKAEAIEWKINYDRMEKEFKKYKKIRNENTEDEKPTIQIEDFPKRILEEIERKIKEGECKVVNVCSDSKNDSDLEAVIQELEAEHQGDCNKIYELTTTIKVLAEVISDLKFRLDNC